jgi:drug/metabolite transporter (DMT)-like permease
MPLVADNEAGGKTKLSTTEPGEVGPNDNGVNKWSLAWLVVFVGSGIAIGISFEILQLHAGPARYETFFLSVLGYWAQVLASGSYLLYTGTWRRGLWNRRSMTALAVSSCFDGAAQALNYVAQIEGGYMLFTIFQSSVTLFACAISQLLPWTPRLKRLQWLGVCAIVLGLLLTSIPNPIVARHSFSIGLMCSMLGSFCLASSYPVCELVFRLTPSPPSEEMACFCGSMLNAVAFTIWTLIYTVPRWNSSVIAPIYESRDPSIKWAIVGYSLFAVQVGIHALSFWKSVYIMGTVPTAVSRGVQQAGVFVFAHLLFCSADPTECLWNNGRNHTLWSAWQKTSALLCCCLGVLLYSLGKGKREAAPDTVELNVAEEGQHPARVVTSAYADDEVIE